MSGIIVSREAWGAAPPNAPYTHRELSEVDTCFIHYSDTHETIPPLGRAHDAGVVRGIQRYHQSHGYVDIAYEAIIGTSGDIFVGRPNNAWDGATCHNNRNGYSIAVLTDHFITHAQAESVRFCVALGRLKFRRMARVPSPHSSACATACPGDAIRAWMHAAKW